MQCTICVPSELKRLKRTNRNGVLVLARYEGGLILKRDEQNALWMLPCATLIRGEDLPETARRALGEAIGEAIFTVEELCPYYITDDMGEKSGGYAFLADVTEWPAQSESTSRAFSRLPLGSQTAQSALVFGLHRWAGEFFDERLDLDLLGEVGSH